VFTAEARRHGGNPELLIGRSSFSLVRAGRKTPFPTSSHPTRLRIASTFCADSRENEADNPLLTRKLALTRLFLLGFKSLASLLHQPDNIHRLVSFNALRDHALSILTFRPDLYLASNLRVAVLLRTQDGASADMDRRQFIAKTLAGAMVAVAARSGSWLASSRSLYAQTNLSPESALQELISGNQRFADNRLTSIEHDLQILKEHTVEKQEPFAGVLACADSRVPVELVFDQTIGHIFVTRVAGNVVTPEIIASLEYAVAVLKIRALLVLGHSSCGAVKAAMKADSVPGQISALYPHLRPAVDQSAGNLDKAIEANARSQAELLRTFSTVIRDALKGGTVKVAAGVYDLATVKVALS
jgi:carbonic anhydrase